MRITKEQLVSIAEDTVKRELRTGGDLVCAYITGSLTFPEPLIGGTTDIDIIYVHSLSSEQRREIVPIADDFHLDIAHYPQSFFNQPRQLRTDAWVGGFFCHYPIVLHDNNHWFDYVRSGVFAQFFQPSYVIQRAQPFIETARREWMDLQMRLPEDHHETLQKYINAIENAANAIACLKAVPLTDRRLLLDFPEAAQAVGMPGLLGGLSDLLLPPDPIEPDWDIWVGNWDIAFSNLEQAGHAPLAFSACRRSYYKKAIQGLSESNSQAALWILLRSWTDMSVLLPPDDHSQRGLDDILGHLALDQPSFSGRMDGLDQFLDVVEEAIDNWKSASGL